MTPEWLAQYLRTAIEEEKAAEAAARQRQKAQGEEPPGIRFEGEDDWPLVTPAFVLD